MKPTHGLKSFSWTCCGLILSFGLTTLNLVPCGLGSSDAYSHTGRNRCLRMSVPFRILTVLI